jgi:DNA-directed RNA polymerase subunit RPC12/RpoP
MSQGARQFPCKQCGAGQTFAPGTRELVCPYCGHRDVIPVTPEAIAEYDLEEALLRLPRTEGWGLETRSLHCSNCGATIVFAAGQTAGRCAFCGSNRVLDQEARQGLIRPESLVPFRITRSEAVQRFQVWLRRLWFRPTDLKQLGRLQAITGAYLPFWTFDAFTTSHWTAEAGYHYYETETYEERDAQGNLVTRTRQVQRTRWEPASGFHEEFFDDVLVCASQGVPEGLVQQLCTYDLADLTPYDPSFLAGFVAEEYRVDLPTGWQKARALIQSAVNAACADAVPGDTHRFLNVRTAFSQMRFRHTLLPLWIAAYEYRNRSYRFLVNGQTGEIHGEAPFSPWKIAAAVLLALAIALVIFFLTQSGQGG